MNLDSYLPELQERNQCHRLLTGNGLKRQGTGPAVCRRGRLREGGEKSVAKRLRQRCPTRLICSVLSV